MSAELAVEAVAASADCGGSARELSESPLKHAAGSTLMTMVLSSAEWWWWGVVLVSWALSVVKGLWSRAAPARWFF